eukprot:CAMPEP_0117669036 /NCGR_PEP_ID=MMETSP0804-20121206/11893_1 /TAXON_ID=1074897 /ORGANISM="Tetraselmis astigmatica, Strain CCMP880" /LENGTH=457 /DNA_ID=CAMNT_0005477017 /DNA_START=154 /DNA_END=1524 /DNA_ORIENTATION=+
MSALPGSTGRNRSPSPGRGLPGRRLSTHTGEPASGSARPRMAPSSRSGVRAASARPIKAGIGNVHDDIVQAVYRGNTADAIEEGVAKAKGVGTEVRKEYVETAMVVAQLIQIREMVEDVLKSMDRTGLQHAQKLVEEMLGVTASAPLGGKARSEVTQLPSYIEAMQALDNCAVDVDASDSMAAMDMRGVDEAMARAKAAGNILTLDRLRDFAGQKEVVGQENEYLKRQVGEVGEAAACLRIELDKTKKELNRVQALLEQQDSLVGECRAERDRAKRYAKDLEDEAEERVAEAFAETNRLKADLLTQTDRNKHLQAQLHQKYAEVEELKRMIPAKDRINFARGRRPSDIRTVSSTSTASFGNVSGSGGQVESEASGDGPDVVAAGDFVGAGADGGQADPSSGRLAGSRGVSARARLGGGFGIATEEQSALLATTKREELLEQQVQRLTEKIEKDVSNW